MSMNLEGATHLGQKVAAVYTPITTSLRARAWYLKSSFRVHATLLLPLIAPSKFTYLLCIQHTNLFKYKP
jgi:hypothetical protein